MIAGIAQNALADNVNGSPSAITFNAGATNTDLKVKIVSNTAQSQSGDPVSGCNIGVKNDNLYVDVILSISRQGLTADPGTITFDECGKVQTVTLTSQIAGTYRITASIEDHGKPGGAYHLEPFGTVTVTVVDTIPPNTILDSTPNNPTLSQSAEFTFHATEAGSTFQCSLDGASFSACTSPVSYGPPTSSPLGFGNHNFSVRAIDTSGNVDQSPASFSWTIEEPTISLTVSPLTATWGTEITAQGTANMGGLASLTAELDWGDEAKTPLTITDGSWGPVQHKYKDAKSFDIVATLYNSANVVATSDTVTVTMSKRTSSLSLVIPDTVTGSTGLNARGFLTDSSPTGPGIDGAQITFENLVGIPGGIPDATTDGIGVNAGSGGLSISECEATQPGDPAKSCGSEAVGVDSTPANNMVLHASPGTEFLFPTNTLQAKFFIQDMGTTQFKYELWQNTSPPTRLQCESGVFQCTQTGGGSSIVPVIGGPSFGTAVNGLYKMVIIEVAGSTTTGSVGISAILTSNLDGKPLEQREINFEDMSAGPVTGPITLAAGSYSSIGIVQPQSQQGFTVRAHFLGNDHYEATQSSLQTFATDANTNNQHGIGGEGSTGDGFAASRDTCVIDNDKDGICSTWEDGTVERTAGGSYTLFEQPAGDSIPDIYYEIDCMTGFCPTASDLTAIKARFDLKGIKLHILLDDTNLVVANPFHVWSDSATTPGDSDDNPNNDYATVKNSKFGTATERGGGTLGSGNNNLKAKLQVVRYTLSVQNINSGTNIACGTSGIAELKGNDAVVAKGCGFGTNLAEETRGTLMHEWGHNLGLRHGGGDDVNCKPNQIGVMSYKGQVPTSLMPKPTAAQSGDGDSIVETVNQVPWILDYNREVLTSLAEGSVSDATVINITPSKWIAADGKDQIGSFKIVWGTPQLSTKVQTGYTGASGINWDKDTATSETNQKMDLNYMSVTIGTKQVTACQPANSFNPNYSTNAEAFTSYDEWAIVKANMDDFASYGSFDGVYTDPDFFPEGNSEIFGALNAIGLKFPGVDSPLNNNDIGSTSISKIKQGSTVPVKFDLFDGLGNRITGDNFAAYHIVDKKIGIQVALVTGSTPPADNEYFNPNTTTQPKFSDYFTWDGNKWSFQMGTGKLEVNKTYATRISILIDTGENIVLDAGSDGITFLFNTVKNL